MKQDRFLTGILIAIGILAVLAIALFFLRQNKQDYAPENTPGDIVHNYTLALQKADYQRAYGYLASGESKPNFSNFRQALISQRGQYSDASVQINSAQVTDNDATVDITILHSTSGLFSDLYRDNQVATLKKESADWKITQMAYPYWSYDWYQVPAKPAPVQ